MYIYYIYVYIYILTHDAQSMNTSNRTSCVQVPQVDELQWAHWRIGDNWEGILSVFLKESSNFQRIFFIIF